MALATFPMLRDLRVASLEAAAHGWRSQAKALEAAADDLAHDALAVIRKSWTGRAASGALSNVDVLAKEVGYGSPQALLIVCALDGAAARFRPIQNRLHQLIEDAKKHGLVVTDEGITLPAATHAERHYDENLEHRKQLSAAAGLLRARVAELLLAAESIDRQLASVLDRLGPYRYIEDDFPGDAKAVAELMGIGADAIPAPGSDPRQAAQWWAGLSPESRLTLCNAFPQQVGAVDGLPAVDRNTANRIYLDQVLKHPAHNGEEMARLKQILAAADAQHPGRYFLLGFDPAHDGQAIVAIGNPDTARHTAVFVPGLNTDLGDMPGMIGRADNLANAADNMTPGAPGDVSVVAWLGYDAPELGPSDINLSVALSERSRVGGVALDNFVNGLNVAHDGSQSHVTAVGHSYGTTVVGEAAKTGDGLAVTDIVTAGSPGMHVANASELQIGASHVWAGAAPDDFVANPGNPAAGWWQSDQLLGQGLSNLVESSHGLSPHYEIFGANRYQVDTAGHSAYWSVDTISLSNQAAVIVGDYTAVKLDHGAPPR